MSKKSKFAAGAVIGAVAGIIAGILTAPKSGKETRSDIKTKASELKAKNRHHLKTVAGPALADKKSSRRKKKS